MSITKLPDGRYWHRWRDKCRPDCTGHGKIWPTKREALDHEAQIRLAKARGQRTTSTSLTLEKFVQDRYLPHLEIGRRPNTVSTYRSHLDTHILPKLGRYKLAAIRRADAQAFVAYLNRKLAPSTTETVFAVLRSVL